MARKFKIPKPKMPKIRIPSHVATAGIVMAGIAGVAYLGGHTDDRANRLLRAPEPQNIGQLVDLPSQELGPWRSQYLTQGDNTLDSSELVRMAEHFFFTHAHQFTNFGPNYVPRKGSFGVVDYTLNGFTGPEAVIDWNGDKYTFRVSEDLTFANLYEHE